ncbi:MAG: PSD1 and planctomycete cytochrome C domain-containing protein [Planctomycetaceae bacterium]
MVGLLSAVSWTPACAQTPPADTSPVAAGIAAKGIAFEDEAQAVIAGHCVECHNADAKEAGVDLSSAAGILNGGDSGHIIQPGLPDDSLLFQMIESGRMPPEPHEPLDMSQLESIRRWISDGASFRNARVSEPAITQHDIVPLLHLRCVACHGGRRREADLDLRTKQSILKGGKSGPAAVPGQPSESLIVKRILAEDMPPRRQLVSVSVKPMEALELARLAKWIERGLPESDPAADREAWAHEASVSDEDRNFWSFQPPERPAVPDVASSDRVANPIDAFVLQKLQQHGLTLSPNADRTTLLRRVTFDLTGLPPLPEDIDAFVNDHDPLAWEKQVDRLLDSRQYGERWARHWLDIAGYADSEGAQNEDRVRPHMYRYRDYVIRSFNSDKPYSRFLLEQIAGDELADYEHAEIIDDEICDNLVATGFLRTAPDRTFANITNFVPDRLEVIADEMDILGTAVMGLTLKCARCHSHKFDPIPQRDYYRLTAIFKDAYDEHDWLKSQGPRTLPYVTTAERRAFEQHEAAITQKVDAVRKELAATDLDEQKKKLEQQITQLESQRMPEPRIRALWSRGEPSPSYILMRGNYLTPGHPVEPGVPAVLSRDDAPLDIRPPWNDGRSTGRRLAFARWLTRPDHPLTARVMVNRIWQHHFGQGIVTTPGNFGRAGAAPTHPELLDWLATEFVRQNFSIKAMHRLIVTSNTYRQSSAVTGESPQRDPDGLLYSRAPLRRLEAEVLRDTLLFVSGKLNDTPYGPADPVDLRADGLVTSRESENGWRRSIYVLQRRTQIPTLLENFDYPQMGPNCIQRGESLVAPQALHLLNNRMIHQLASHFAERIRSEAGDDRAAQISVAYRRAFSRYPSEEEVTAAAEALEQLTTQWAESSNSKVGMQGTDQQALVTWCHAMFNLAEFIYVD